MSTSESDLSKESVAGGNSPGEAALWSTELSQLHKDASLLQKVLQDSATSLGGGNEIPGESLIAALTAFRDLFNQVSTAALTALQGESGDSGVTPPKSIAELQTLIDRLLTVRRDSAQRRAAIRNVISPLDDVLKLEVRGGGEFTPLNDCKNKATSLKDTIALLHDPERDAQFVSVRDGTHPLCLLIRFVTTWDSLDLEQAELLRQRVAEEFGNLLATAIMRQHIVLPSTTSRTSDLPQEVAVPQSAVTQHGRSAPTIAALHARGKSATKDVLTRKPTDEMRRALILGKATEQPVDNLLERISLDDSIELTSAIPATSPSEHKKHMPEALPTNDSRTHSDKSHDAGLLSDTPEGKDKIASTSILSAPESAKVTNEHAIDSASALPNARVARLRLSSGMSVESVAQSILNGENRAQPLLIWALLRNGQFALAYQLSRCEAARGNMECLPPSSIRAVILARRVRGDYGSCEEDYQHSLQTCYSFLTAQINDAETAVANSCLMLAITLAPALLARASGAASVLASIDLRNSLGPIDPLRQAVLRFSNLNFDLNPGLLGGSREHTKWLQRLADLRETCRRWFQDANQRSIIYAPTTDVWKYWLREDQPLGVMLGAVISDQRQRVADVDEFVSTWRSRPHFERQMLRADQQHRGRNAELRPIQARAITGLRKHFDGAIDLVLRWKALLAAEPARLDSYQSKQADLCRVAVTGHLSHAIDAMRRESVTRSHDLMLQSAFAVVTDSLNALGNLFKSEIDAKQELAPLRILLGADLLRIPGVKIDDDWELVEPGSPAVSDALVRIVADGREPNWEEVVDMQCGAGQFDNAQHAVSLMEYWHPERVANADSNLQKALATARERLRAHRNEMETRVHRSNVDGLLTEESYHDLTTRLAVDIQSCMDFGPPNELIDRIGEELETARQERVNAVWLRLKGLSSVSQGDDNWKRIEQVLSSGDVLTANEYLTMLEQDKALPPAEIGDPHSNFFPTFLNDFREKLPKMPHLADIEHQLADRRPLGPLNLNDMPKTTADDAVRLVSAWGRVLLQRRNPTQLGAAVREVLTLLGFRIHTIKDANFSGDSASFVLEAETIRNRATCVIPYFASEARGRYRILCMGGSPLEHTIIEAVERHQRDVPVIVFYMGFMDSNRRRALANECRSKNRSLLVLDTYLLLYLCAHRNRLAAFMQSATWFTTARPYTTTGTVPPEMFFGRKRQLERIVDMRGTNLVYGGRQLGKTALLREVERSYHNPAQGCVVLWIDLTHGENIGTTRAIADLWTVLAKHLADHGIGHRNISTPERLEQSVIEWLDADPARRILLLLDEADAFMAADRAQSTPAWAQVSRLKSLMDRTQIRFKVVFAGLHNVQRTARDPNTPIAHLGEPECIGAFLSDEEMREAQGMIVQPLRALGYVFGSSDLPTRILAYTNYYPSLIQVFCRSLLEYLQKEAFDQGSTPPYVVTLDHIEKTYKDNKAAILQRFNWSLDLDERYRVLALVIAIEIVQPGSIALTEGISVSQIRRESLGYWQEGFRGDTSMEAFRSLLEEMIGLGILRRTSSERFTLRSPNVINLLGTHEQIERQLEEAAARQPAPPYEANSFRRKLEPNSWTRSPLSAAQETELLKRENGVAIVFGCNAAGIQDVPTAITQLPQVMVMRLSPSISSLGSFQTHSLRLIQERKDGLTLIVIPPECAWDSFWVEEAVALTTKHHASTARLFRFVFVGGPEQAWDWLHSDHSSATTQATVLSLHPWHEHALSRWLDDLRVGRSEARREPLLAATGAWGRLLHDLGSQLGDDPVKWTKLLADAQQHVDERVDIRQLFGIHSPTATQILKTFADFGYDGDGKDSQPLAFDDLMSLLEPPLNDQAEAVIRWAETLGYVRLVDARRWALNSILTRLLRDV